MKTICILSENTAFVKPIENYLKQNKLTVITTSDYAALSEYDRTNRVHLIMIDFDMLPLPMIKDEIKLELEIKNAPVILLVRAENMMNYKVFFGVDDIILRPLNLEEVFARIMLRLYNVREYIDEDMIKYDIITLDPVKYEVRIKGRVVDFTLKEYELLKFLITNPGRVFTRDYLLEKVWGYDYFGGTRTVDVHIRRIRSKIELADIVYIETVRGVGYRFKE